MASIMNSDHLLCSSFLSLSSTKTGKCLPLRPPHPLPMHPTSFRSLPTHSLRKLGEETLHIKGECDRNSVSDHCNPFSIYEHSVWCALAK